MFATDDTIVAIATPPGPGGIGIVRMSGARAVQIAGAVLSGPACLEPRRATLTEALDPAGGRAIDRVLATYFPGPRSYTGEDVIEISAHGSPVVLRRIVEAATVAGARLAEPGEFTFRAFLGGRIDLVQAEAIHDLVTAVTPRQARVAFDQLEGTATAAIGAIEQVLFDLVARLEASLDFPEEGYHFVDARAAGLEAGSLADRVRGLIDASRRGRLIREGCQVTVAGKPNVGKSSLFNALCGVQRTIVADTAGTTRDMVTETVHLEGIPVTLVDTAGIRSTTDTVEAEGVNRARGAVEVATAVVVLLDRSRVFDDDDRLLLGETAGRPRLVVVNKRDLPAAWSPSEQAVAGNWNYMVETCLIDGSSVDAIRGALLRVLEAEAPDRDTPAISNARHIGLLAVAEAALRRASTAAARGATEELLLADLAEARRAFEEVTGERTPDAVLERIFERFCIGK